MSSSASKKPIRRLGDKELAEYVKRAIKVLKGVETIDKVTVVKRVLRYDKALNRPAVERYLAQRTPQELAELGFPSTMNNPQTPTRVISPATWRSTWRFHS